MRSLSTRAKWAIGVGALASAVALYAWSRPSGPHETTTTGDVDEPAAPAPDRLLADVFVGSPNASWSKLQRGVGGPAGILPASAGGILCAIVGIDPAVAFEVDGASPAYGVVAGDPAAPGWAFALKLANVPHARALLVEGDVARFTPREANGYTELLPKGNAPPPQGAVALSKNGFLVVARKAEDLPALAPYLTRTLPKRPPQEGAIVAEVPRASIANVLAPKLASSWADLKAFLLSEDVRMRKEHGGRPPDFGDPEAIVAAIDAVVSQRLAVLGDLERLRVAIETEEDGTSIDVTMTPATPDGAAKKWIQAMRTGDAAPVLSMASTSAVALSMRDGDADRAAQAEGLDKALTSSLGTRLGEGEAKRVHDVLADATKARGDTLALALAWDDPNGVFVRADARDADAASRAVKGAIELARAAPFKEIFRVKDVASSAEDVAGLGKASLATITREPKSPAPLPAPLRARDAGAPAAARDGGAATAKPSAVGLAWAVDGGVLSLAAGPEPLVTLRLGAKPEKKLADEPEVARSLSSLGTNASTIVVAQPLRFDPVRANLPVAPLVVAVGRKGGDAFVRVDVTAGVLREIARRFVGL